MSLTSFYQIELARKIPIVPRTFENFLNKIDTTMPADSITVIELKEAFFR